MPGDAWADTSARMKKGITEQRSILSQFPPDAATITARELILSIAADCACKKAATVAATAETTVTTLATGQAKQRALGGGRHFSGGGGGGETKPAAVPPTRFSVKIDTDDDLKWVMQAINYGLTMSADHWDIVSHSVHIYCDWLACLLLDQSATTSLHQVPAKRGSIFPLPRALLGDPGGYARRMLWALARFFAPRPIPSTTTTTTNTTAAATTTTGSDANTTLLPVIGADTLFSLMHQSPHDPADPLLVAVGSVQEIVRASGSGVSTQQPVTGCVAGEGERWLQDKYIPLVASIATRVEEVIFSSPHLDAALWDQLIEFCLAITFAVLSVPPQIDPAVITSARPFSQSPGVRGMLQLECQVVGLLIRVWLRALAHHFPSEGQWQGLREVFAVSRHRIGLSYVWSRTLLVMAYNLLQPRHLIDRLSRPSGFGLTPAIDKASGGASLPETRIFSAFLPLTARQDLLELPPDVSEVAWFWMLNIYGNPVDLCHPLLVAHTATFEVFRRYGGPTAIASSRLTAVFMPAIFHQVMRSLATLVDLLLGLAPSLAGSLSTFVGVPPALYGPLTDVAEYFQYASVRSANVTFKEATTTEQTQQGTGSDSVPAGATLANVIRNAGLSSSLLHPQSVAEAWLRPDPIVVTFYNRPSVVSFNRLFGSWLFEASLGGPKPSSNGNSKDSSVMLSKRGVKVDNVGFQVGRAEAMASLCRIFIYARNNCVPLELLTRFYVCLLRALTVDSEVEYVLATVLFHSPDLLRADLTAAFTVLAPALFNAVSWVLRQPSIVCPDYVSMVLLRRASLHQLLSMVCLSDQFSGVQFQELSQPAGESGALATAHSLRTRLSALLIEFLAYETDTHNLRMLLSAAYTLVMDMTTQELSHVSVASGNKIAKSGSAENPVEVDLSSEAASGLYVVLVEKICGGLRRWMNDCAVCSFALDILSSLANAPVPQPTISSSRRCIQSICAFIEAQCRREKKDHTRALHSLIINAYQCLGLWLVSHPRAATADAETLRSVIETIRLGIFGAESVASPSALTASESQTPGTKESVALPSGMPFSKRVNEAAEHLLSSLFSTVGSFPHSSGPENPSCRFTEDHITSLAHLPHSAFQFFFAAPSPGPSLGPIVPDLLLSIAETNSRASGSPRVVKKLLEPAPVITFIRDASGRHLWSWRLRYEPRDAEGKAVAAETTPKARNTRHMRSCLENGWPLRMAGEAEDPFMPRTRESVPLVRAEKEMPTLVHSVFGSTARREVDTIKSLIAADAKNTAALGRHLREIRVRNAANTADESLCRPQHRVDRLSSGHLLSCHLGYVPVNALQASSNSFQPPPQSDQSQTSGSATNNQSQAGVARHAPASTPQIGSCIPGTRGAGAGVEPASLIPSALTPLDPTLVRQWDSSLNVGQRSTATAFIFYVKQGQTEMEDVIGNMNSWTELPRDFRNFVEALGWSVDALTHAGWSGPQPGLRSTAVGGGDARLSGFDPLRHRSRLSRPDGVENFVYWADATAEVVAICPSRRTLIDRRKTTAPPAEDFRAGVLWLESWDDATWVACQPSEGGGTSSTSSNPLLASLTTVFELSLVILLHPQTNTGLVRVGLIRPRDLGHEAGPLATGLLLSGPLIGSMVRSTLVGVLHRLAADSGDPATAVARRRLVNVATGGAKARRPASAVELLLWSAERCY